MERSDWSDLCCPHVHDLEIPRSDLIGPKLKWSDPIGRRIPGVGLNPGHRFFPPPTITPIPSHHHNSNFLLLHTRPLRSNLQLIIMPIIGSLMKTDVRGRPITDLPFPAPGIPCTCPPYPGYRPPGCDPCHGGDGNCLRDAVKSGFLTVEDHLNFCDSDDVILPCQLRLGNYERCWDCDFCAYDLHFADKADMNDFKEREGLAAFEIHKNEVSPDSCCRYPMTWPYNVISIEERRFLFPYLSR